MNAILLTALILSGALQNVTKKIYNQKTGDRGVYLFSTLMGLTASIFFICSAGGKLQFTPELLPYSLGFAASFAVTTICSVLAIVHGSLSLTALILSYSLMMPTLYGLIFLHEPAGPRLYLGIALLLISLVLIHFEKGDTKFSLKWVLYVVLAFLGNGMCAILQKMQQIASGGLYRDEFMFLALLVASVLMLFLTALLERKHAVIDLKKGWFWAVFCGLMNGVTNLLVMVLAGTMSVSLLFPLFSAGGIVLTFLISKFAYHESLSKLQLAGFGVGVLSVVFLSM